MFPVIEGIRAFAAANAAAPALVGTGLLTYADVLDKVARISNHFADRKIPPRSKVFLNFTDPDLRLVVSLACLHYGLVPFILVDPDQVGGAGVDYDFVIGSTNPYRPDIPLDLVIDRTVLEGRFSDPVLRAFADIDDEDILYIGMTGGTKSGGRLVAQRAASYRIRSEGQKAIVSAGDRVAFTLGDVSKYGFSRSLLILNQGGALVRILDNPVETLKLFNLAQLNILFTTPHGADQMLGVMESEGIRCPSLGTIHLSGSIFHPPLLERLETYFPGAQVTVYYGSGEVGKISSGPVHAADYKAGYVGEISHNIDVIGAGTETEPGPIRLRNDGSIFCEYYSGGVVTLSTEPVYAMPDLGYLDGRRLYLVGRDDEVLNLSGNKIPFSRFEGVLRGMPGVTDVGIVGDVPLDGVGGAIVGLVCEDGVSLDQVAQKTWAAMGIPVMTSLLRFFRIDNILRNATGKVDRQALLKAFADSQTRGTTAKEST